MITSIERFQNADGSIGTVAIGGSTATQMVGCQIGETATGTVRWADGRFYNYDLTLLQGRMVEAALSIGESMGQVANYVKKFGTNPTPV